MTAIGVSAGMSPCGHRRTAAPAGEAARALHQAGGDGQQLPRLDRLREMRLVAGVEGLAAILLAGEGGQGDGRQHVGAVALADAPDQVVAVLVGERDVADDDGRPHRLDARDRGVDVGGVGDLRAGVLEHAADQDARVEVVLDHEDADAVEAGQRHRGRRRRGCGSARAAPAAAAAR